MSSSAGRAAVSKTAGRRFDPCLTCHLNKNIMLNWLTKTRKFISGTLEELHKCTWPTKDELFQSTVIVLIAIFILTAFVFGVDMASVKIISWLTTGF